MSRSGALNVAYAIRRGRAGGGRLYRAEGGGAEFPAWMNADTLGPVSGPQDEMTRALPDYESRDPGDLAMLRHRQMVRPDAGRQDFPMEHLANMATAAAAFSPLGASRVAGAVLAPQFAAGRAIAEGTHAAAQYAPRFTTAALAGVGALSPSMTEGAEGQYASLPKDPKDIMALQAQLKAAGYPIEKIDGVINPGGPTERAFRQFQQDQATRRAEELQRQQLETQQGTNAATLETARANKATADARLEADRLKAQKDADDLARRQAGDARLREIEKNRSLANVIMQDYAGPAGYAAGIVTGVGGRALSSWANNSISQGRAAAGDAIIKTPIVGKGQNAAMERVARANEFWRAGGAKEVPFTASPTKAPGFEVNPNATPLSKVYDPYIHPAVEGGVTALPVVESGVGSYLKSGYEDDLKQALRDYGTDQSEANIQRIQNARDNVGLSTGIENMGRTWAGSNLVGAAVHRYGKMPANMRPNMAPAEQEQLALQKILRDAHEKVAKKALASAPRKPPPILPSTPALTVDAARARNGAIPTQAQGGAIRSPMGIAYALRRQQRAEGGAVHAGPILSSVPGRTDNHPMDVTEGSYVLPADHVSSLGEGNTSAGMEVIQHMLGQMGGEGAESQRGEPVPINAAGGEFVIAPEVVAAIGGGDIKRGHEMLDQWVLMNRRKHISTLRKLPGPAKS